MTSPPWARYLNLEGDHHHLLCDGLRNGTALPTVLSALAYPDENEHASLITTTKDRIFDEIRLCDRCMKIYWSEVTKDYEHYAPLDSERLKYALTDFASKDVVDQFENLISQVLSSPIVLRGHRYMEHLFIKEFVRYQKVRKVHYIPNLKDRKYLPMTLLLLLHDDDSGRRWARSSVKYLKSQKATEGLLHVDEKLLEEMGSAWSDITSWLYVHAGFSKQPDKDGYHLASDSSAFYSGLLEIFCLFDDSAWLSASKNDTHLLNAFIKVASTQMDQPNAAQWHQVVRQALLAHRSLFWERCTQSNVAEFCELFLFPFQVKSGPIAPDSLSIMCEVIVSSLAVPFKEGAKLITALQKLIAFSSAFSSGCKSTLLALISSHCEKEVEKGVQPNEWLQAFCEELFFCDNRNFKQVHRMVKTILTNDVQLVRGLYDRVKSSGIEITEQLFEKQASRCFVSRSLWMSFVNGDNMPPLPFIRVLLNTFGFLCVVDSTYLRNTSKGSQGKRLVVVFLSESYNLMSQVLNQMMQSLLKPILPQYVYRSLMVAEASGSNKNTEMDTSSALLGLLSMLVCPDKSLRQLAETLFQQAGQVPRSEIPSFLMKVSSELFLLALFQLLDSMFAASSPDEWEMKLACRISMLYADFVSFEIVANDWITVESPQKAFMLYNIFCYGWQLFMAIIQLNKVRDWPDKLLPGLTMATLCALRGAESLLEKYMNSPYAFILKGEQPSQSQTCQSFVVRFHQPINWIIGLISAVVTEKYTDVSVKLLARCISTIGSLNIDLDDVSISQLSVLLENGSLPEQQRNILVDAIFNSRLRPSVKSVLIKQKSETAELQDQKVDMSWSLIDDSIQEDKSNKSATSKRKTKNVGSGKESLRDSASSESEQEPLKEKRTSIGLLLADCEPYKETINVSAKSSVTLASRPQQLNEKPRKTLMIDYPALTNQKLNNINSLNQIILAPSLDKLHEKVLSWNFWTLIEDHKSFDATLELRVADSFKSIDEYYRVFEPLLLSECRAQIIRRFEENLDNDAIQIKLASVGNVDSFHEITFNLKPEQVSVLSENDLILLTAWDNVGKEDIFQSFSGYKDSDEKPAVFFGKVHSLNTRAALSQVTVRVCIKNDHKVFGSLRKGTSWACLATDSLTTINREFQSLLCLQYYPLCNEILDPKSYQPSLNLENYQSQIDSAQKTFHLNEPQAAVVVASLKQKEGFLLVQGPPGTGKTKTILGCIGAMLSEHGNLIMMPSSANSFTNHILVCAPSNAAIDEIVRRMRRGIYNSRGTLFHPKAVRLGTVEGVSDSVKDMTLDNIVENRLMEDPQISSMIRAQSSPNHRERLNVIEQQLEKQKQLFATTEQTYTVDNDIQSLAFEKRKLQAAIFDEINSRDSGRKLLDFARQRIRIQVLNEANVILCTLTMSGHDTLARDLSHGFETVIIDEACQAIELSTLIPLKYNCKRCILVGDPNQLPPTVLSNNAAKFDYQQSLFVRLQKGRSKSSTFLLAYQYRMHPDIAKFPNTIFYDSLLKDGEEMKEKCSRPWHKHRDNMFPPYRFFDIARGKEDTSKRGQSLYNTDEALAVLQIFDKLCVEHPDINFAGRVGIITPYKEQRRCLTRQFVNRYQRSILQTVDINTIDGFQGQEKDIIILSCVRANATQTIGFLSDVRRLNVALTRAKCSLWIFGHATSLVGNSCWKKLIDDAKSRNMFLQTGLPIYKHKFASPSPDNAHTWPFVEPKSKTEEKEASSLKRNANASNEAIEILSAKRVKSAQEVSSASDSRSEPKLENQTEENARKTSNHSTNTTKNPVETVQAKPKSTSSSQSSTQKSFQFEKIEFTPKSSSSSQDGDQRRPSNVSTVSQLKPSIHERVSFSSGKDSFGRKTYPRTSQPAWPPSKQIDEDDPLGKIKITVENPRPRQLPSPSIRERLSFENRQSSAAQISAFFYPNSLEQASPPPPVGNPSRTAPRVEFRKSSLYDPALERESPDSLPGPGRKTPYIDLEEAADERQSRVIHDHGHIRISCENPLYGIESTPGDKSFNEKP